MQARIHNNWNSHILLVMLQNTTATWENSLAAYYRVIIHFGNPTSRFDPREMRPCMSTQNLHTNVLAALLIITKNWKQPKYPKTAERMKSVVHSDNGILLTKELQILHGIG